jgi:DNA topoisomerase-3
LKVCIAEKPSVAKEIAEILGAKTRKDGYFEGNGYQITWTFGHLCTLKEPEDYHPDLKRWRLEHLPILPPKFGIKEISNKGISKQLQVISRLVTNADEVINCGDAGQEGEVIQRWVLTYVKCNKPVKRLWISSLTSEAIQEGFKNLKDSKNYDKLYAAGSSRAIGDWLLGINATRLYTLKFGQNKQVLSIGRVQTPTLALIVNRYLEIQNFKPENYWEIKTRYKEVLFSARKGKFFNQEEATEFISKIQDHDFTIVSFTKKKGKESPPKLFDLTSVQVECNKKFGFSADQTLKLVQSLYEKKLVTYPRVDTCFLPNDIYPKIKGILESLNNYHELANPLLSEPIRKSKLVFDDKKVTDHHAIIPTNVKGFVGGAEHQVYDLIVRRFLAAFYPDCIVSRTEVLGEVAEQEFKATGKQILDEGWRKVYQEEKEEKEEKDPKKDQDDEDSNQLLPEFAEGEKGPHTPELAEKQTRPPKLYTEATLLRAMETAGKQVADEELRDLMKENGIGRPSTRANIIETLFRRNYIAKERKNLVPTITGVQLIGTIQYDILKSAELTGAWEKKLRDIEKGVFETSVFLEEMKSMIQEIVHQVKTSRSFVRIETLVKSEENPEKKSKEKFTEKDSIQANLCPKCNKGSLLKGKKAFGCSEYKAGCNFIAPFELFGKKLTEKQLFTLVQKKKSPLIKGLKQASDIVNGYIVINHNFGFEIQVQEDKTSATVKTNQCPKCNKAEVIKGQKAYGCANWKSGCDFRLPMQFEMIEIDSEILGKLLTNFKTGLLSLKDMQGNTINKTLQLDKKTFQLSLV